MIENHENLPKKTPTTVEVLCFADSIRSDTRSVPAYHSNEVAIAFLFSFLLNQNLYPRLTLKRLSLVSEDF